MPPPILRTARPDDYDAIAAVIDDWWGREMLAGLQRLFLDHFWATSVVADVDGEMAGFLVGFHSPAADAACIHFVGVDPAHRRRGLAAQMYRAFFITAADAGCARVDAITSPVNTGSIAFHRRMGFEVHGPLADYNGPGRDMMLFSRRLPEQ